MDSSDNVTSEKCSDFEDGICDPDLEARLYAEIYYSNETYAKDFEGKQQENIESADTARNVTLLLTQASLGYTNNANVNLLLQNKVNCLPAANFLEDCRGNICHPIPESNLGKKYCSARASVFDKSHRRIHQDFKCCNLRKFQKSHRLLARKGLWLTEESPEEHTSMVCEPASRPLEITESTEEDPAKDPEHTVPTNNCVIHRTAINEHIDDRRNSHSRRKIKKCTVSKKEGKNAKKRKRDKIPTKAFCGTKLLRRHEDAVNSIGVTMETSKYRVVSKIKKLKMREENLESVEISSDSDDSILEVPVPPKVQPPVIQLPDSDEDCDITSSACEDNNSVSLGYDDKEFVPCYDVETDFSSSDESSGPLPRESSASNFNENNAGITISGAPPATETHTETMFFTGNNLILNCTDLQRGASSLEEIKKIREIGMLTHGHSDDSMTESEATNWGNIATGQTKSTGHQEISSIDESVDGPYRSLWNHLTLDNPTGVDCPNKDLASSSNTAFLAGTIDVSESDANFSLVKYDEQQIQKTRIKRQKNIDSSIELKKLNVPKIPEKRSKRKIDKSSTEKSLTEYFFKPMSKELQAFYNNPWGSEHLDLYNIQSRMPRNPRYWAILDADLGPPSKRRGKTCMRCRTNSHFGKRCPEKSSEPCCCMCGNKGHIETRCPQTMCLTCGQKYATFRPRCSYCSKLNCNMCNGIGHTRENCPDLWRRYHDTTTETLPVLSDPRNVMKAPQYLSCSNCAKRGHDATMCMQLRWSQHFPTPMHVSSYTDGPIYYSSLHDRIQDTNSNGCIEIVQAPDGGRALTINLPNSVSQDTLFQCGNFDFSESMQCHETSKFLDTLKNAYLGGLLGGDIKPTFLNTWQNNFVFNVRITRGSDERVRLLIQANCEELLCGIEKLLSQWLTRSDDEKPYLIYDALPYENIERMTIELRRRVLQLGTVLGPTDLLRKITGSEETLKHTNTKVIQTQSTRKTSKCGRRRNNAIQDTIRSIMNRRCQLVTSLYSQSWVEGSDTIVDSFRKLVRQLKWSPKRISISDYLEVVYLYNEIFTFHTSDALVEALEKATSMTQLSEPITPALQPSPQDRITLSDVNSPSEKIEKHDFHGRKSYADCNNRELRDRSLPHKNILADCSSQLLSHHEQPSIVPVNDEAEYLPMPENFTMSERSNLIATSSASETDIHCSNDPKASFKSDSLSRFHSLKSHQTLLLNHYGKKNRDYRKNVDRNEELLVNLKKKKRKLYRRSARAAIKLANSSNTPHLQRMAAALKFKMTDCSIRTDDVQSLQNAISANLSRNKRNMREPC